MIDRLRALVDQAIDFVISVMENLGYAKSIRAVEVHK